MPSNKKLRILPLAAVIFLTVSGGPYGLEPLISYVGGNGALLMLVLTPILWDIPTILTVMELNSMMPVTGGYYQWVKRALGLRWGFYEGWWTWLYTFVDLAIYPQLFITYATLFFPQIAVYHVPIYLCMVWLGAGLNILGIVQVGKISSILSVFVVLPFLVLFGYFISHHNVHFQFTAITSGSLQSSLIGMGLLTVMWNFIGWDNVTTYAEEVDNSVKAYIKAIIIAFAAVLILYFITVLVAQQSGIDPGKLKEIGFSAVGYQLGQSWIGMAIAIGGVMSSLGLFCAVLLSVSRIPQIMAADKLLPKQITKLHPKFGTPYISIIICAAIVSCLVLLTFGELLIIDISVYFAGLSLEFITLIVMRIKEPHAERPFRIPFGIVGLCLMLVLPVAVYVTAITDVILKTSDIKPVLVALGMLVSGEVAWRIIVWHNPGLKKWAYTEVAE